jgi:hypothetical protein
MKKIKLSLTAIIILCFSASSCSKSEHGIEELTNKPKVSLITADVGGILLNDEDFIQVYRNAKKLQATIKEISTKYPDLNVLGLQEALQNCESLNDMKTVFLRFGIAEGNTIISLHEDSYNRVTSIREKHSELRALSDQELITLAIDKFSFLNSIKFVGKTCEQAYADAVGDCDEAYMSSMGYGWLTAITTGWSGGGLVATGIQVANALTSYITCLKIAKRSYEDCKN